MTKVSTLLDLLFIGTCIIKNSSVINVKLGNQCGCGPKISHVLCTLFYLVHPFTRTSSYSTLLHYKLLNTVPCCTEWCLSLINTFTVIKIYGHTIVDLYSQFIGYTLAGFHTGSFVGGGGGGYVSMLWTNIVVSRGSECPKKVFNLQPLWLHFDLFWPKLESLRKPCGLWLHFS